MASKMENRVSFLENQLSNCLDNLDNFCVQLTVIQDFLQKQFGSRFVDYAENRGVYINKTPKPSKASGNAYYTNLEPVSGAGKKSAAAAAAQGYEIEDYVEEGHDPSDPLAYVEIIDDSGAGTKGQHYENAYENDAEGGEDLGDDAQYYEQQDGEMMEEGEYEENEDYSDGGVSEKGKLDLPPIIKLPDPPAVTSRPPPSRTYVKTETKPRPPSNFLSRKRPSAASASSSIPKMPVLQPQPLMTAPPVDEYEDMLDFNNLTELAEAGSMDGLSFVDARGGDGDGNEDLREFYDVLPDKSVKCRICEKVLKAGWHKFGRHYRTHTGEKPFSCPICSEAFARKDNMNNHIKSKHENIKRPRTDDGAQNQNSNDYTPVYYLPSELC